MRPIESGRKPRGSRAAKMRSRVIITIENAPSTCPQRIGDGIHQRAGPRVRDELDDDLGVGRGLKVCAVALEFRANRPEVHQVAIVRNRDQALGRLHANGLRIQQRRVAGCRVARVSDRHVAGKLVQHFVGEDLRNQAHALDVGEMLSVGGGDARRFLSAMLQRIQAEVGLPGGVGMSVDGDDAALFVQLVGVVHRSWSSAFVHSCKAWMWRRSMLRDPLVAAIGSCHHLVVESCFERLRPRCTQFGKGRGDQHIARRPRFPGDRRRWSRCERERS